MTADSTCRRATTGTHSVERTASRTLWGGTATRNVNRLSFEEAVQASESETRDATGMGSSRTGGERMETRESPRRVVRTTDLRDATAVNAIPSYSEAAAPEASTAGETNDEETRRTTGPASPDVIHSASAASFVKACEDLKDLAGAPWRNSRTLNGEPATQMTLNTLRGREFGTRKVSVSNRAVAFAFSGAPRYIPVNLRPDVTTRRRRRPADKRTPNGGTSPPAYIKTPSLNVYLETSLGAIINGLSESRTARIETIIVQPAA
ncbi:hypothetical protein V8D89_006085 [Ganoderma adspersum]